LSEQGRIEAYVYKNSRPSEGERICRA